MRDNFPSTPKTRQTLGGLNGYSAGKLISILNAPLLKGGESYIPSQRQILSVRYFGEWYSTYGNNESLPVEYVRVVHYDVLEVALGFLTEINQFLQTHAHAN